MKINVACGFKQKFGHINVDSDPRVNPDVVANMENGLPFGNEVAEEILSEHTLEHISPDKIHFVMFDLWRILKPGGLLKVVVPIGKGLLNSPEHKSMWDHKSWLFFTDWNLREKYKFNLVDECVKGEDITEELHFILEAIK